MMIGFEHPMVDVKSLLGAMVSLVATVYGKEIQALASALFSRLLAHWRSSAREGTVVCREVKPSRLSITISGISVFSDMTRNSDVVTENVHALGKENVSDESSDHSVSQEQAGEGFIKANAKRPSRRPSMDSYTTDTASFAENSVCDEKKTSNLGHNSMTTITTENKSLIGHSKALAVKVDISLLEEESDTDGRSLKIQEPVNSSQAAELTAVSRIAQNVKRRMRKQALCFPVGKTSSSGSLNTALFGSLSGRDSHPSKPRRVHTSDSLSSKDSTCGNGDEGCPKGPKTLARRASINRSDHRQQRPAMPQDVPCKLPVRRGLHRSASEAVVCSNPNDPRKGTKPLNTSCHSKQRGNRRGVANTRSYKRSSSDVDKKPHQSDPHNRRAAALKRVASSRMLQSRRLSGDSEKPHRPAPPERALSMQQNNTRMLTRSRSSRFTAEPKRGNLRACRSHSIRDFSRGNVPRRTSSISTEDRQILRNVEQRLY